MIEMDGRLRHLYGEIIHVPRSSRLHCLTPAELVEEQRTGGLILDTRAADKFALLHLRRSLQLGLGGPFAGWAAILLHPGERVVLVSEDEQSAQEAAIRLARVGVEGVIGYSPADETQWRENNLDLAAISTHRSTELRHILEINRSLQLIDVRSHSEWLKGHLPGAISIPLLDLDRKTQDIDRSQPILVYCHEGFRATTAASILLREREGEVGILIDGVEGWLESGSALESKKISDCFDRICDPFAHFPIAGEKSCVSDQNLADPQRALSKLGR